MRKTAYGGVAVQPDTVGSWSVRVRVIVTRVRVTEARVGISVHAKSLARDSVQNDKVYGISVVFPILYYPQHTKSRV